MPKEPQRELEAVVQAAIRGATVLTGNTRASRFLLAECDKVLRRSGDAWKTPDILPLATWVLFIASVPLAFMPATHPCLQQ